MYMPLVKNSALNVARVRTYAHAILKYFISYGGIFIRMKKWYRRAFEGSLRRTFQILDVVRTTVLRNRDADRLNVYCLKLFVSHYSLNGALLRLRVTRLKILFALPTCFETDRSVRCTDTNLPPTSCVNSREGINWPVFSQIFHGNDQRSSPFHPRAFDGFFVSRPLGPVVIICYATRCNRLSCRWRYTNRYRLSRNNPRVELSYRVAPGKWKNVFVSSSSFFFRSFL